MITIDNLTIKDVNILMSKNTFKLVIDNLMFIKFNTYNDDYIEYLLPDISDFLTALCKKIELKTNKEKYGFSLSYININKYHTLYQQTNVNKIEIITSIIRNSNIAILHEFYLYSKIKYTNQILEILDRIAFNYNITDYRYVDYTIRYFGYELKNLYSIAKDIFLEMSENKIRQYKLNFIDNL